MFMQLTTIKGNRFILNINMIISIHDSIYSGKKGSVIYLSHNLKYYVIETIDEIKTKRHEI